MKDLSKILAASRDASSEGVKIIKKSLKSPIELQPVMKKVFEMTLKVSIIISLSIIIILS